MIIWKRYKELINFDFLANFLMTKPKFITIKSVAALFCNESFWCFLILIKLKFYLEKTRNQNQIKSLAATVVLEFTTSTTILMLKPTT